MHPSLLPADWPAPPRVRGFATLRHGAGVSRAPFDDFNLGARCGDEPEAVARNRAGLVRIGGLPSAPHWLRQVHGAAVWRPGEERPHPSPLPQAGEGANPSLLPHAREGADPSFLPHAREGADPSLLPLAGEGARRADEGARSAEPEADAAVTSTPGAVLAILTADCLPVLLCADDGSEVAAAHAGWRGLAAGVLEATVAAMRTPPDRLIAWLGPAAGPERYEVGDEVRDAFVSADPDAAASFTPTRPEHWHVDLYALARRRLQRAGLAAANIHGGGLCTIGDPQRFYSHRRDARTGRMATLAWIDPRG